MIGSAVWNSMLTCVFKRSVWFENCFTIFIFDIYIYIIYNIVIGSHHITNNKKQQMFVCVISHSFHPFDHSLLHKLGILSHSLCHNLSLFAFITSLEAHLFREYFDQWWLLFTISTSFFGSVCFCVSLCFEWTGIPNTVLYYVKVGFFSLSNFLRVLYMCAVKLKSALNCWKCFINSLYWISSYAKHRL